MASFDVKLDGFRHDTGGVRAVLKSGACQAELLRLAQGLCASANAQAAGHAIQPELDDTMDAAARKKARRHVYHHKGSAYRASAELHSHVAVGQVWPANDVGKLDQNQFHTLDGLAH